jgi:drug/metabolite transporter (DMT)-like permease
MTHKTPSLTGYLFALAATAIWSGNFVIARGLSDSISPVTLAFLRFTTAIIFLLPFGLRSFCRDLGLVRRHLGYLALTAFLGLTVCNTFVYIAAHTSETLNLSLIALCSPIFVAVFARLFLRDTLTFARIAGLITATFGAALLITGGRISRLTSLTFSHGDIWMVGQAASFALYSILVQVKPAEISHGTLLSSLFVLGWLLLIPWFVWEISGLHTISFSPTVFAAIVYLGIGPSLVAYLCWNRAVRDIGSVRAGLVSYCLPLFCGIEAYLLLNEPVSWIHVLSGALILVGVFVATRE